ncbi:hypothetical protein ES705_25241 [subsurface metagenome]
MLIFPKYQHVKTLVFNNPNNAVITPGTLFSTSFTFTLKGILNLPYYLIALHYYPLIHDFDLGPKKIFNYDDPLLGIRLGITTVDSKGLLGDDISLDISPEAMPLPWTRAEMQFQPGIHYDLSNVPIKISDGQFDVHIACLVDVTYVVIGAVHLYHAFSFSIGTN